MATNWPSNWPVPADELNIFDAESDVLFILTRSTLKHATIEEDYTEFQSSEPLPPKEEDDAIIPEFPTNFDVDVIMETELSGYTRASQADLIPAPSTSRIDVSIDVHLRASSKHLTHASPIFHRMLGPDFKEGGILKAQGSVAIPLPDDDPDAMIILLNIIPGRTRQVPRSIGFGTTMLTELATLVDYYHLFEVVELFSDTWLQNSTRGRTLQESYRHSDTLQWLWISWVFQDAQLFKKMTQLAEVNSEDDSDWVETDIMWESDLRQEYADGLPIPAWILDAISSRRNAAICKAVKLVHGLIAEYAGEDIICDDTTDEDGNELSEKSSKVCDTLVLGSLMKGATQANIWPKPVGPPYDFTFGALAKSIREIKIYTLCSQSNNVPDTHDVHSIQESLHCSLAEIEESLCGLELNDFMPEERRREFK